MPRKSARHEKYLRDNPWIRHRTAAMGRCHYKKAGGYERYGGRGIKFLLTIEEMKEIWFRDKAYLLERPSLDRKDVDGHYEKSNCRFIELRINCGLARQKRGEENPGAKLNWEKVKEIRRRHVPGMIGPLAREFGVCYSTIRNIVRGKKWADGGKI